MATKIYRDVSANGDTTIWTLTFENRGLFNCYNAKVVLNIPDGASVIGATDLTKGQFNFSTTTWFLGTVNASTIVSGNVVPESHTIVLEFQVDDITEAPITISARAMSSCAQSDSVDSWAYLVLREGVADCGDLVINDGTPSTQNVSIS